MCVFISFLNADIVPQHLISMGNAFHRRGLTTRKDRSPKLASFVRRISSKYYSDERVRPGLCPLAGLPDTGEPSHSDIGTHGEVFYTRFELYTCRLLYHDTNATCLHNFHHLYHHTNTTYLHTSRHLYIKNATYLHIYIPSIISIITQTQSTYITSIVSITQTPRTYIPTYLPSSLSSNKHHAPTHISSSFYHKRHVHTYISSHKYHVPT